MADPYDYLISGVCCPECGECDPDVGDGMRLSLAILWAKQHAKEFHGRCVCFRWEHDADCPELKERDESRLVGVDVIPDPDVIVPNGCLECRVGEAFHHGFSHAYVEPGDAVRKQRMRERAALRRYREALAMGLSDHEAREDGWPEGEDWSYSPESWIRA